MQKTAYNNASMRGGVWRSRHVDDTDISFSMNMGLLIPFFRKDVLPGETLRLKSNFVVRTNAPLKTPAFANLFFETAYFYVASRTLLKKYVNFYGQKDKGLGDWDDDEEVTLPRILFPGNSETGFATGFKDKDGNAGNFFSSMVDYIGGLGDGICLLNDNAVGEIRREYIDGIKDVWNWYYRDQNLEAPIETYFDNENDINAADYIGGLMPFPIARYHDLFSSCLPGTQKGAPVKIALSGEAPVRVGNVHDANEKYIEEQEKTYMTPLIYRAFGFPYEPNVNAFNLSLLDRQPYNNRYAHFFRNVNETISEAAQIDPTDRSYAQVESAAVYSPETEHFYATNTNSQRINYSFGNFNNNTAVPVNLWADTSSISGIEMNALRTLMAYQSVLERDARGGTRFDEIILSQFNVVMPPNQWKPEFLGGRRCPIDINQINQVSETAATPLGTVAGQIWSGADGETVTKSFVEPGIVFGFCYIRQKHSYPQGQDKCFRKRRRYDFYLPEFNNLPEQPVKRGEIFYTGTDADDNVFGYNEAWYENRTLTDRVAGSLRSSYTKGSLDIWHIADKYENAPVLSKEWIYENPAYFDRVLQIPSTEEDVFIVNANTEVDMILPMTKFSIPGYVDHF